MYRFLLWTSGILTALIILGFTTGDMGAIFLLAVLFLVGPITKLLIFAIPAIFVALLVGKLSGVIFSRSLQSAPITAAIVFACFLAVPGMQNWWIQRSIDKMSNGGLYTGSKFERGSSIAYVSHWVHKRQQPPNEPFCLDFCMRGLLNGTAGSVFVQQGPITPFPFSPDTKVIRYWLEKRPVCPPTPTLQAGGNQPHEKKRIFLGSAGKLMKRHVATGTCLLSETAKLGDAGVVIVEGNDRTAKAFGAASIARLNAFERRQGFDIPVFQSVRIFRSPMFYPSLQFGTQPGTIDGDISQPDRAGLENFLLHAGIDLSLENVEAPDLRGSLRAALADPAAGPEDTRFIHAGIYFGELSGRQNVRPDDADLVAALLNDLRFSAFDNLYHAVGPLAAKAPDQGGNLGDALLWRFVRQNLETRLPETSVSGKRPLIGMLGSAISKLPDEVLMVHHDAILGFSDEPERARYLETARSRLVTILNSNDTVVKQ